MSSLMTNVSAMTALRALQSTNSQMETTQARISTGFRVAEAADNAAYWSIATTMRSDNKALGTVQDALGLGAAKVDIAYTAVNSAIDVVDEIKAKLVAAREPGVDRSKIQTEIDELQNQLTSISNSAAFNGENWLNVDSSAAGYAATESIVSSFNRDATGAVSVGTLTVDKSAIALFDANAGATGILDDNTATTGGAANVAASVSDLDLNTANLNEVDIDGMITITETALQAMTDAASDLGSAKKRIDLQTDFVSTLMDSIDRGVGQLVDADMSAESTKLQALQVQQQLGIQALSIANSNAQSILSLFRG
ncbi:flagellin [Roseitalea porphyridii]|uniref:Flagellin n=1 Tax=Roseitalea porphyridii TaxID=1852022 RepID=A0A4P6V0W7_9HYPH|nr:flagellin [Roseitalea porphyridii]QBK30493.1 flagellin [Roseitalea porphyridii]